MENRAASVRIEALLRHRGWVRGLARRLVGEQGVDDVEQQTWLAALRSPPREGGSIPAWLATVVRNVVRKRVRTDDRRTHREAQVDAPRPVRSTADVVADADAHQRVVQAVMALEEPYRTTVLLRFFEDLPPREVAVRMDTAVETVRTRTRRALERLRSSLDDDYGGREPWLLALTPLCVPDGVARTLPRGTAAALTGAGVLAMTTTKKILVAAALLAAIVGGGYLAVDSIRAGVPADDGVATIDTESQEPGTTRRRRNRTERDAPSTESTQPAPAENGDPVAARKVAITLIREDGGSVAGGSVITFRGEEPPTTATANDAGLATVPARDVEVSVVAILPGLPPRRSTVPAGSEGVTVTFPRGVRLAGIVRVEGVPPAEPIRLSLRMDDPWFDDFGVTAPAREALRKLSFSTFTISTWTRPDGRFAFEGLGAAGPAHLAVPDGGFIDADAEWTWTVQVPDQAVTIDLRRLPVVTGRLVAPDGSPVPNGQLRILFEYGDATTSMGRRTDDAGEFEVVAPSFDYRATTLTYSDAQGIGEREIDVAQEPGRDLALGDLTIGSPLRATLLVVDAAGKPVEGAVAMLGDRGREALGRTTENGLLPVVVPADDPGVRVTALGYDVARVVIPLNAPDPWRVQLSTGTLVTLQIKATGGADVSQFGVRLMAEQGFFNGKHRAYDSAYEAAGSAASGAAMSSEEASYAWFQPGADGVVRIAGVVPHIRVRLALFDSYGRHHTDAEINLEPGQQLPLALTVAGTPRTIRGVVRDQAGNPVARARISIAAAGADRTSAEAINGPDRVFWSGPDGTFAATQVFAQRVDVTVEAKGFAPWSARGAEVDGKPFVTTLGPGRTVVVAPTLPADTSLDDVYVFFRVPGAGGLRVWAEANDDGTFTAKDLPRADLEGVVEIGGDEHPFAASATEDRIVLDLRAGE